MRKLPLVLAFICCCAVPALADTPPTPPAAEAAAKEEPPKEVLEYFNLMTGALEDKDYQTFITPIDETVRGFMSKTMFDKAVEMFGARLAAGYEAKYLERAQRADGTVYVWKISFKDKKDEFIAVMSMKGKKVGMFFFL